MVKCPAKSTFRRQELCHAGRVTDEPDGNAPRPNYRWPWFVLALVLLGIVLAIGWMTYAVQREKAERDFSAPLPSQGR